MKKKSAGGEVKSTKRTQARRAASATPGGAARMGKAARPAKSAKAGPVAAKRGSGKGAAKRKEPAKPELLFEGKHLKLVSHGGWEACERTKASGVVAIVAVTPEGKLLLTEQYRPPVGRRVIELPAGLSGDVPGAELEELAEAARRELVEETGYDAASLTLLTEGPSSAGLTSETVSIFRADGVHRVGAGGGDASESIEVHEIPLNDVRKWLRGRHSAGVLIDYKIYAGLELIAAPRA